MRHRNLTADQNTKLFETKGGDQAHVHPHHRKELQSVGDTPHKDMSNCYRRFFWASCMLCTFSLRIPCRLGRPPRSGGWSCRTVCRDPNGASQTPLPVRDATQWLAPRFDEPPRPLIQHSKCAVLSAQCNHPSRKGLQRQRILRLGTLPRTTPQHAEHGQY